MLKPLLLTLADIFASCCVITPLVITFWATVWEFILRHDRFFPVWWTLGVCWALQVSITLVRDILYDVNVKFRGWRYKIASRVFIYVFGLVGISGWRSLWLINDGHLNFSQTVLLLVVSLAPFSVLSGGINNLLATPYSVGVDHDRATLYKYTTVFNVKSTQNVGWYLLDCVFSVCVVGTLVVFVWRGSWTLLEIYLFPGRPDMSALASLGIGYALVIVTFLLQPVMKYFARTLKGVFRLVVVDIYLLLSFSGTINVWRGVWNSLNVFFLPDMPLLSLFITHSLCFLLLVLINSSNSILVRGVYIDGAEEGEQCVDFPCYYIRLFFQEKRKKKLLKASEQRKFSLKSPEAETLMTNSTKPEIVSNHSANSTPNSV